MDYSTPVLRLLSFVFAFCLSAQSSAQTAAQPAVQQPSVANAGAPAAAPGSAAAPTSTTEASLPKQNTEQHFESALAAIQKSDTSLAQAHLLEAVRQTEDNPFLLYNLGVVEQKRSLNGKALALWRKALALRPSFAPARQAIIWTKSKLEHPEIAHDVVFTETLHKSLLIYYSLDQALALTAIAMFLAGWWMLRYFGARRQAKLDDTPMPGFPYLGSLMTLIFVATLTLALVKMYDSSLLRGTIIVKQIEARSSPESSATALFDLYEGLEVIVLQTANSGAWAQVNYPGGSTGWIPKSAIFTTEDSSLVMKSLAKNGPKGL